MNRIKAGKNKRLSGRLFAVLILLQALLLSACGSATMQDASEMSGVRGAESASVSPDNASVSTESTSQSPETAGTTDAAIYEFTAPDWARDAVLYEVNVRQYTEEGTFAAFGEHLEELKEMGINTLWLMPIFPISEQNRIGSLGSYYSVKDYRDVNPEFGDLADFGALVEQAHGMGFHVILDWVANHTGWDHAWITEHPDWYTQENGKITEPAGTGWSDVADLNYDNPEMRAEMIRCMRFWVETYGVDGFRCDYAVGVPADFWVEARAQLEQTKPLFFLEEDLAGQSDVLLEQAFDSNYAGKFYETLVPVAKDGKTADKLKLYLQKMPEGDFPMFYLDNHDVNSYDRTIAQAFGPEQLPALYTFIYTMPGMPMIYSGDEIGYDKAISFFDRDPIDWTAGNGDYRALLKALGEMKSAHPALRAGSGDAAVEYLDTGKKSIFAFRRKSEQETLLCIFLLGTRPLEDVDLGGILPEGGEVIFSGIGETWEAGGEMPDPVSTWELWQYVIVKQP